MSQRLRGLLCLGSLFLGSCVGLGATTAPRHATVHRPVSRQVAYQCAIAAVATRGGQLTAHDPQGGLLSANIRNTVLLTVRMTPEAQGTRIDVSGAIPTDKIIIGRFDEVEQYATLLHQCS